MQRHNQQWSRRRFLAAGGLAVACSAAARHSWAAPGVSGAGLRLAYFTDVHTRVEWDTPLALDLAAARINETAADLVLAGGDLITDGFQSSVATVAPRWDAYLEHLHRAVRPRVEAVPGNHDLVAALPEDGTQAATDPRAEFLARLGLERTYRTFEANGVRFFLIDAIQIVGGDLKYRGFLDEIQQAWIRSELQRVDQDTPIILMTHMPLLTGFYQATKGATEAAPANRVVVNNREVLDLFAQHNLILVLQGHLHVNELLRWRKTTFIMGGAVCAQYWRGPWHGTEEGFGVITLKDGRVDWDYIDLGWQARRPAGV